MRESTVIREKAILAIRSYLEGSLSTWMNSSETRLSRRVLKKWKSFMTYSKRLTNMSLFLLNS